MAVGTFVNLDCEQSEDSGFQGLDCGFFVSGTWILLSLSCILDSPPPPKKKNISWIPDSKNKSFLDYGIRIPSRGAKGMSWLGERRVRFSRRG